MTILKKSIRTWFAIILSLILLTAVIHSLAALGFRSDAAEAKTDARYVKVLADIHEQNLNVEKVKDVLSAEEESSPRNLFHFVIGVLVIFVSYSLIFRCVARVILGEWKGPWIS